MAALSLRAKVRSSIIQKGLRIDQLLHIERRQLRWLRVLIRMTLRSLPGNMFLRPGSRPKTHWRDYISQLVWERLGELLEELKEAAREREVWA